MPPSTSYPFMPPRGAEEAPIFDNIGHPQSLPRYLSELDFLFLRSNVTSDREKKAHAVRYLDFTTSEMWESLPEYSNLSSSYANFTRALYELYPHCLEAERHSYKELELFVQKAETTGIHSLSDLGTYNRAFLTISTPLIRQNRLDDLEEKRFYIQGFHSSLRTRILDKLQLKFIDRLPDIPYDIPDVYQAAKFILYPHTSNQPSEFVSPAPSVSPSSSIHLPTSSINPAAFSQPDPPIQSFMSSIPLYPPGLPIVPTVLRSKPIEISFTPVEHIPSSTQSTTPSIPRSEFAPEIPEIISAPSSVSSSPALVPPPDDRISKIQDEIQQLERIKHLERQINTLRTTQDVVQAQKRAVFIKELEAKSTNRSTAAVSAFSLKNIESLPIPEPKVDTLPSTDVPIVQTALFVQEPQSSLKTIANPPSCTPSIASAIRTSPTNPESICTPTSIEDTPPIVSHSLALEDPAHCLSSVENASIPSSIPSSILSPSLQPSISSNFALGSSQKSFNISPSLYPAFLNPSLSIQSYFQCVSFIFHSFQPLIFILNSLLTANFDRHKFNKDLIFEPSFSRGPPLFPIRKGR